MRRPYNTSLRRVACEIAAAALPCRVDVDARRIDGLRYQLRRLGRHDIGLAADPDGGLWARKYKLGLDKSEAV